MTQKHGSEAQERPQCLAWLEIRGAPRPTNQPGIADSAGDDTGERPARIDFRPSLEKPGKENFSPRSTISLAFSYQTRFAVPDIYQTAGVGSQGLCPLMHKGGKDRLVHTVD